MDDQDLIREQMENTRSALAEKLETLEERVTTTVQDATEEVAQTVETVTETVQGTVATVKETVDKTLSTVNESVTAIRDIFNLPQHVKRHPWVSMAGSAAFGFMLGGYFRMGARPRGAAVPANDHGNGAAVLPKSDSATTSAGRNGQGSDSQQAAMEGGGVLESLAPELNELKALAIGTLMGTVREMVVEAAGKNLGPSLAEIIDKMTEKIGGKPIHHEGAADSGPPAESANI